MSSGWIVLGIIVIIVLFAIGFYKARITVGRPGRSGLQIAAIGLAAAAVGILVGLVLRAPVVP